MKFEIRNSKFEIYEYGFTIIELIISIAILGIIMAAVSSIFATALKNYKTNFNKSGLQKELNFTLDNVAKDIKQAVEVPENHEGYVLATGPSPAATLVLALPSTDADGNFIYTGDSLEKDYIVYYLSGSDLYKRTYANPLGTRSDQDTKILSNISSLTYAFSPGVPNPDQVKATLSLSMTLGKSNVSVSGERTANLRNKE